MICFFFNSKISFFKFKYDLYTREQLFQFCDQGKKYAECVNKRLQCCDLKSEHAGALAAFDVGLQQNVRFYIELKKSTGFIDYVLIFL